MKKLFSAAIALAIMIASCVENNAKTETSETPATESTVSVPTAEPTADSSNDVPKFSSPEVQKLANDYAAYVKETVAAAKSRDATQMQAIATKAQEWTTKTQEAAAKMTPEDAKLWSDFAQKLATQMAGNH